MNNKTKSLVGILAAFSFLNSPNEKCIVEQTQVGFPEEFVEYCVGPNGERMTHYVYDGFALNGMSAANIEAKRASREDEWEIVWTHPYRGDSGFYERILGEVLEPKTKI